MKYFEFLPIILLTYFSSFCATAAGNEILTKKPEVATIGILVVNVYELDMTTNSFSADFYLWCKWKGSIDPLKNVEFTNAKETWGFTRQELYEAPLKLKGDTLYSAIHVQGKFHHNFVLDRYPLDSQKIKILIENSIYTSKELIYKPDTKNSLIEPDVKIPGWAIKKFESENSEHVYGSNFGLPENANNDKYCNLSFSLTLSRPLEFFVWKLLLPVLIVLLSGLGATIIFPGYVDARIYAPVGALLTTVFLQQSYSAQLPEISYLILTDKIYVVIYIAILVGIFHAIYTANLVREQSDEGYRKARTLDKIYILSILVFLLVSFFAILF